MKLSQFQISLLGALDGLVLGTVLETVRLIHAKKELSHELAQADAYQSGIGYLLEPTANAFLPLLFVVALAAISHLVHKYFVNRPKRLLLLWLVFGFLSVIAGRHMTPIGSAGDWSLAYLVAFATISYLAYYGWMRRPKCPTWLWPVVGITAVVVVAAGTQTIGLFRVERPQLRDPFTWLLCLTIVLLVNLLFGAALRLITRNYTWSET